MAHFYGIVSGFAKTNATRRGNKASGLTTVAASYSGAIQVELSHDADLRDRYRVYLMDWPSRYHRLLIAEGWLHQRQPLAA